MLKVILAPSKALRSTLWNSESDIGIVIVLPQALPAKERQERGGDRECFTKSCYCCECVVDG